MFLCRFRCEWVSCVNKTFIKDKPKKESCYRLTLSAHNKHFGFQCCVHMSYFDMSDDWGDSYMDQHHLCEKMSKPCSYYPAWINCNDLNHLQWLITPFSHIFNWKWSQLKCPLKKFLKVHFLSFHKNKTALLLKFFLNQLISSYKLISSWISQRDQLSFYLSESKTKMYKHLEFIMLARTPVIWSMCAH